MRWIVAVLLVAHGLIHLMGFAKAFGYANLPQLTQSISRVMGLVWLTSGLLMLVGAAIWLTRPRGFWIVGAVGLVLSQVVIVSAWRDAWAGTIMNAILLLLVTHGWLTEGPFSLRAQFERDIADGLARPLEAGLVTDADLASVPEPVRRYLIAIGVVGQPRVRNYRLRFLGRIRSGPDSAWVPFEAEQQSFADRPARFFFMRARMSGMPVEVFHRLTGGRATMRVKVAGVATMVDARGDEMDRSESVTLFNDMCLLAPGTLLDPGITWEGSDERTARARFTNGRHSISASLSFGNDGLLANFISDDRSRSSPDGKTFTRLRFTTPVRDYRAFGPVRLAAHGDARWTLPEGEFTYGEFDLQEVQYNVQRQD